MAIARGAGTEILRSAHFEDVDATDQILIFGVQHHIYTVLQIQAMAVSLSANYDYLQFMLKGYDSKAGTTAQNINLFRWETASYKETWIWGEKFSFNGFEPTDFAGPMDDVTKQDAIADQGSSVAQYLFVVSEHASDNFEIMVSFIDQNNA